MVEHPSDLSEDDFQDYLETVLISHFGEDKVNRHPRLESDRIPDFTVETIFGTAMVETENRASEAIGGKGQCEHYAAHDLSAYAIVLFPASDWEEDLKYFGDGVCFMQYEFKPDEPEEAEILPCGRGVVIQDD